MCLLLLSLKQLSIEQQQGGESNRLMGNVFFILLLTAPLKADQRLDTPLKTLPHHQHTFSFTISQLCTAAVTTGRSS